MSLLLIRTDNDTQTNYLYVWSEYVIQEAEKRQINIFRLESNDINKKEFEKRIRKHNPAFVFFNGHGTKTSFLDNNKEEFLNVDSVSCLKGTIAFARACDSLKVLGVEAIKKGCASFIGYKQKFWIARLHEMASRPLSDPVARAILDGSNLIASGLLKGKTTRESVNSSHEYAAKTILRLISSKDPFTSPTLAAIIHNDSNLDFEGDPFAKL